MHKALIAIPFAALALAACGESGKDAGVESRSSGDRPVYNMPDEFPNISAVCIKSHLVIETTQSSSSKGFWVSPTADPSCAGLDGKPPRQVAG